MILSQSQKERLSIQKWGQKEAWERKKKTGEVISFDSWFHFRQCATLQFAFILRDQQWSISPTYVHSVQQKICSSISPTIDSPNSRLKSLENSPYLCAVLPFTVRQKELLILFVQKSQAKMLVTLTPAVNFINVKRTHFFVRIFYQRQHLTRKSFQNDVCTKKFICKNVYKIDYRCRFHQQFLSSFFYQKHKHSYAMLDLCIGHCAQGS